MSSPPENDLVDINMAKRGNPEIDHIAIEDKAELEKGDASRLPMADEKGFNFP